MASGDKIPAALAPNAVAPLHFKNSLRFNEWPPQCESRISAENYWQRKNILQGASAADNTIIERNPKAGCSKTHDEPLFAALRPRIVPLKTLLLDGKRFKPERAPDLTRELTHTTRVVITASSERALPEGSLRGQASESFWNAGIKV